MSKGLQQWFNLVMMHEYFNKDVCTVFKIQPCVATRRLMKNYGIHIQQLGNIYKGYVEVAETKAIWEELDSQEDLYFQLMNTDCNFDNYTDIPSSNEENKLLYITNATVANRMHTEEFVTPDVYLPKSALRFNVSVPNDTSVTVVIKDSLGKEIYKQDSLLKQSSISVDIEVFGAGIYEVWIDDKRIQTFFGTSEKIAENCYGILHLQMRTLVESLKENTMPSLQVKFSAKATYWQYAVVVPNDKKIKIQELTLEGVDEILYAGPEKKEIAGGIESKVFTSLQVIKLQQKATKHPLLKIKYNNDFSDTVLELDLKMPIPNVSKIVAKKQNNENLLYSQTIIYV